MVTNIIDFTDKQYLNLEIIKNHLNIEQQFDADDMYLYALLDVAQAAVEKYLDIPLEDMENNDGMLPSPILHAILLLIGTFYAQRESVSTASMQPVPNAFELLCDLYRNYSSDLAIKRPSE
jgi:hypothetical protein